MTDDETTLFDTLEQEISTAVVSDVLDRLGHRDQAMDARIRPVWPGAVLVGRAHTLLSVDSDAALDDPYGMEIGAVDATLPNGVLVASTNRSTHTCLWGELLSISTTSPRGEVAARSSTATPATSVRSRRCASPCSPPA